MALENTISCPICGHDIFKDLFTAQDHTATKEIFQLKVCTSCQLIITSPRPDATTIGKYYESNEYISHTDGKTGLFDTIYRIARTRALKQKLNLVKRYQPAPGAILDYGAGTGKFITHCAGHHWQSTAVEPSPQARQKIPTHINVHPDLGQITTTFDAITLWHVLEHVHELRPTLTDLVEHLKPTGTIFIAVPNHQSYDAQHYQSYWAGYDVPRHLWHFDKTNMKQLLETSGLKLLSIQPMKLDSFYVSLLSEQYQHPKVSVLKRTFSAMMTGLLSNLRAGTDNYSSLIYIAGK